MCFFAEFLDLKFSTCWLLEIYIYIFNLKSYLIQRKWRYKELIIILYNLLAIG